MRLISLFADQWLGLCRKPPVVRTMQTSFGFSQESLHEGLPDGGGRSGTIRRGIKATLSAMRTLNRNRQLLWFTLLAGLVLAGNAIGHAAHHYIYRIMQTSHFAAGEGPGYIFGLSLSYIGSYVLDFFIAFTTLFCLVFLLAGLVLSISSKKEGPVSFFEGLAKAKKYLKALILWSVVLALAGMLLDRIYVYVTIIWFPHELGFLYNFGLTGIITQFPFNWTLDWNMLTEVPGYGGRSLLLWIYPSGFMETLGFSAITLLMFILTPFVVPLIVLEHKTIWQAVVGSFALMKKTWADASVCAVFLGVIVYGVFLTYLLVQAASGIISPYETVIFHPTGTWIALAIFYNIALLVVAFVVATVGGIALLDLYRSANTGQVPGSAGTEPFP